MNARQEQIRRLIAQTGSATVSGIARRFGVSPMTVRRDLACLESLGAIARTHGGAMLARAGIIEFRFAERDRRNAEAKAAIAAAVAEMVRPGMSISLDTGTTTLAVARALARVGDIRILTSSLAIASALYANDGIQLVLLGGTVRKGNPDLTGPLTEDNLGRFRVDLAVLGADALKPDGLFANDMGVARLCMRMIERAKRVVVAADSSKFTATAFCKYAEWPAIDALVTAPEPPAEARGWLERAVRNRIVVKLPRPLDGRRERLENWRGHEHGL